MTPFTVLVSRPYPDPPHPSGGQWGDLAAPNYVFSLLMGPDQPGRQVESTFGAMDPLEESLPIGDSLSCHLSIVGLF